MITRSYTLPPREILQLLPPLLVLFLSIIQSSPPSQRKIVFLSPPWSTRLFPPLPLNPIRRLPVSFFVWTLDQGRNLGVSIELFFSHFFPRLTPSFGYSTTLMDGPRVFTGRLSFTLPSNRSHSREASIMHLSPVPIFLSKLGHCTSNRLSIRLRCEHTWQ